MNYSSIITIEPGKRGGKPCIRVAAGNCPTSRIEDVLRAHRSDIRAFLEDAAESVLVIKARGA
jgi:predicted nuclease of predicted toxin-antitoxin system